MKINMPMTITAADSNTRTVTGRIVTWNEEGNTSAGRTVFLPNSIQLGKNVKLLWEHRLEKPLGKLMAAEITDQGIEAQFKIAGTIAGDDYLTEAAEGLRDGLSVGVKIDSWSNNEGVLTIDAAKLIEVSAVTEPAISSARISDVAASDPQEENSDSATAEADQTTEGENVSDTTTPAPAETPAVEAAKSEAPAVTAAFYSKPRVNLNVTAGQYAMAQIRAAQGDTDSRDLVAALDAATTTENIGVVPPTYLRDIIGIIDNSMPFADSIEQGTLPATGMKFYRPVLGVQATTAQTAEAVELDSTDTTITSLEIDVVKIGGANKISVELLERSDPEYLSVLLSELAASWAQKADAYAFAQALGAPGSSSGATLYAAIADGIADSFGVVRKTPNRFLADTGNFAELLAAVDDNKRPLFAAAAPQNAAGLMTQGSTAGTIAGLQLVVDANIDTGTGVKGVIYPSDAATFYKSAAFQIRSNVVSTAEVEVGLYGYVALARKYATAFRNLTVA
jgi:HK97 family phage prohead protease